MKNDKKKIVKRVDLFGLELHSVKSICNWYYFMCFVAMMSLLSCKKTIENIPVHEKSILKPGVSNAASNGIGGFDFSSTLDKAIAFDYDHSGKLDHLVCYRPGSRVVYIVHHGAGNNYTQTIFRSGIGGYDLADTRDQIMAYDYEGSGKQDYLLLYRPGTGAVWILQNNNGVFTPVFQSGTGIATFNLGHNEDRLCTFDYDHSGKMNYLVGYRSGTGGTNTFGSVWVIAHPNPLNTTFTQVTYSTQGIAGYRVSDPSGNLLEWAFAFDYDHTGRNDYLVFYDNQTHVVGNYYGYCLGEVIRNTSGNYTNVFDFSFINQINSQSAYRAYNFGFDLSHSGKSDYFIYYQPGSGLFYIYQNNNNGSSFTLQSSTNTGVGGYDLQSGYDKLLPFDYDHSGKQDYLCAYRPGSKAFWIIKNWGTGSSPSFQQIY